jgi:hypothetical protein
MLISARWLPGGTWVLAIKEAAKLKMARKTTRHRKKVIRTCNEMFRGIEKQEVMLKLLSHAAPFGFNIVVQVAVSSAAREPFITVEVSL